MLTTSIESIKSMAASKFKPVWNLISEYRLNTDKLSTSENLKCDLCYKLLRDACLSSSCGCQYCYECIYEYMDREEKYCPGVKEGCRDQYIVFGANVFRSEMLNKKISRIKVECPNESCTDNIELIQMEDHLRVCNKRFMKCPFVAIGCSSEPINKDILESHLNSDNVTHTQLLIELIQNLKNELNELKEQFAKSKLESTNKDNRIATLEERLNKEIEMRVNIERQRTEELEELRRQIEYASVDRETSVLKVNDLGQNIYGVTELNNCYEKIDGRMYKQNELCPNIVGNFKWQIDQVSSKKDKDFYSEPFYSNNYKFCLRLYISSYNDNIILHCFIMKGDNDDMVKWPMKRSVTLSIVDQVTMTAYKSITYKYYFYNWNKSAYERPTKDINDCYIGSRYYSSPFTKYSQIKDKAFLIVNDSIIVSCSVNDH